MGRPRRRRRRRAHAALTGHRTRTATLQWVAHKEGVKNRKKNFAR